MNFLGLPNGIDFPLTRRILHMVSAHPYWDLLRLLWPFPWHLQHSLPLPRPQAFADDQNLFYSRNPLIPQIRLVPLFRARDCPLASFYRIYEAMCAGHGPAVGSETEYFWRRPEDEWTLESMPDPKDADPVRYAMLASLMEAMVDAFNWRLELGLRRGGKRWVEREDDGTPAPFVPEVMPAWAERVPALEDELVIIEGGRGPRFVARNIICHEGDLRTV
ncbi:hypothetical protein VC83_02546 [Pseudogymnoascus destructans]|uniref:Uncharacterized protein n=2 Tax=Pseudogymnoascus destructans TaxID=655981 RepID=L8FNA8_PSED2|nr:uncharacterized protein VC83_02546 [Pseudogymnoascus destructans]ELR02397.1 hypothetical protein GMDG_05455 [Pseudogymnoascus destructans 20631-21]OAF60848.1 hypothetical protein VC83_02546 [Pseudogymnoascus destructans]